MINLVGGRKAAATITVLAAGIGCVALKGDVPDNFLSLLQTIFGAFVLGNVGSHFAGAYRAKFDGGEPREIAHVHYTNVNPQPEAPVEDELDEDAFAPQTPTPVANGQTVDTTITELQTAVAGQQQALAYIVGFIQRLEQTQAVNNSKAAANRAIFNDNV